MGTDAATGSDRLRPVTAGIGALLRATPRLRPRLERLLWRAFYELASVGGRNLGTTLMNYGYAASEAPEADLAGHPDRFGLQLYAAVAGAVELSGRDVLEVGCGRGGGAAFIFERFAPRTVTGLDLAATAVRRCRKQYGRPGLSFVVGDAEALPFGDGSFDAVVNVESSHCYSDVPRFLADVRRVLRPGGWLLLADFRATQLAELEPGQDHGSWEDVAILRSQLSEAGFRAVQEEDITAAVLRGLRLNTPVARARIERRVPRLFRRHALEFAGIEGSAVYRALHDGGLTYLRFALAAD